MYQYQVNSPHDIRWLHAGTQQDCDTWCFADRGQERRSRFSQHSDSSVQSSPVFSPYQRSAVSVQPIPPEWPDFIRAAQSDDLVSSSTARGYPASLAPWQAASSGSNAQSNTQYSQWQSPSQQRSSIASAQLGGLVHCQPHDTLPVPPQGVYHHVHQVDVHADRFAADLLNKTDPLLTNFALQVQSKDARSSPTLSTGRQLDFFPHEGCAFPAAPQLPDIPYSSVTEGPAPLLADLGRRPGERLIHCAVPQTLGRMEPADEACFCPSERCKPPGLTSEDLHAAMRKLTDISEISSPEADASNSEDGRRNDGKREHLPKSSGRKRVKIDHITVAFLEEHKCFDMPLAEAARYLNVGLSVMKRICRTLGLARWPYRTRASLQNVIDKTERYLALNSDSEDGDGQKAHVIEALQSQMSSVTGQGNSDLNSAIKKYRQSIFKLNYKLKRSKSSPSARQKIAVPRNAAERILADQS